MINYLWQDPETNQVKMQIIDGSKLLDLQAFVFTQLFFPKNTQDAKSLEDIIGMYRAQEDVNRTMFYKSIYPIDILHDYSYIYDYAYTDFSPQFPVDRDGKWRRIWTMVEVLQDTELPWFQLPIIYDDVIPYLTPEYLEEKFITAESEAEQDGRLFGHQMYLDTDLWPHIEKVFASN